MPLQTECFECTINSCGQRFSRNQPLSYYLHIRDDHSATYKQNKEYIEAKVTVLKYEDSELGSFSTDGLQL